MIKHTPVPNLQIRSYSSPCLQSVIVWYYVHIVHKELQKMAILSIISMLWYPICTGTAPSMKKERRPFISIFLSISINPNHYPEKKQTGGDGEMVDSQTTQVPDLLTF